MPDTPTTGPGATPSIVEEPMEAAQRIAADPAAKGTPEWLAAVELIRENGGKAARHFGDLEREMQALKGMSEI